MTNVNLLRKHTLLQKQQNCSKQDETSSPRLVEHDGINLQPVHPPSARSLPPVAHASGSHTLTLPNNSLVLRGSVTDGDPAEVHFLWVRDSQSPAAGVSERSLDT